MDWYNTTGLAGAPVARTLGLGPAATAPLRANWSTNAPVTGVNPDNFGFRATGYLTFPTAGTYHFTLNVDNSARIWINNVLLADHANWALPRTFYIPNVPAGTIWPIKIEMGEETIDARFDLTWQTPGTGSQVPIPATALNPGYGLTTTSTTADTGTGTPALVTTSNYGDKPWEGLAVSVTQADGGAGLTSTVSYDSLRRRTARALPTGDISNPDKRWTDTYYGNTETRANPCVGGSPAVNQAGRLKTNTGPLNSGGGRITTEAVYDILGRVVAARINTGGWVCTAYDARGRVTTVTYPATTDDPGTPINDAVAARTATTNYAVGGNPLISAVADSAGTVTTTVDRLGRAVSYTDVHGTITTTSYTQDGKVNSEATTGGGGGVTSTLGYTYTPTGQIDTVTLDGGTIAATAYDTAGELSGVTYSNATSGTLTRDNHGRPASVAWALAGGRSVTNTVTRSQTGRVVTDQVADSTTGSTGWAYTYDAAGRLSTANLTATTTRALSYDYTAATNGSCPTGSVALAGRNHHRVTTGTTVGASPATTASYCYDQADRLLAVLGNNAATNTYDSRGNQTGTTPTSGGATWMVFDATNRHIRTDTPNTTGGGTATIIYTRDATDRITRRTITGSTTTSENGVYNLSYTAGGDTPDIELTTTNSILTRSIVLPGGTTLTKNYPAPTDTRWHYPTIHGDNTLSTDNTGTVQGGISVYDPYGQPLTSAGAIDFHAITNTNQSAYDHGWLGQHQRGTEHTAGLGYTEMGARVYQPTTGRFLSTDPVEGGAPNDYTYPTDPINQTDLDGKIWWALLYIALAAVQSATVRGAMSYTPSGPANAGKVCGSWNAYCAAPTGGGRHSGGSGTFQKSKPTYSRAPIIYGNKNAATIAAQQFANNYRGPGKAKFRGACSSCNHVHVDITRNGELLHTRHYYYRGGKNPPRRR